MESPDSSEYDVENEFQKIVSPLLQHSRISYFCFVRRYKDNSRVCLSTHRHWNRAYISEKLFIFDIFEKEECFLNNDYMLWDTLEKNKVYELAKSDFDIIHHLTMVEKRLEFTDFFHFGSNIKENIVQNSEYLKNIDVLTLFTQYFKDSISSILPAVERLQIEKHHATSCLNSDNEDLLLNDFSLLVDAIPINRYYFMLDNKQIYLSKREFECVKWLVRGKSATEIAKILSISQKTVQKHIENVKNKMNCYKQSTLIYKLLSENYFSSLLF